MPRRYLYNLVQMLEFGGKNMFTLQYLKVVQKKLSEIVLNTFANFAVREKMLSCSVLVLVHMLVQDEQIIEKHQNIG